MPRLAALSIALAGGACGGSASGSGSTTASLPTVASCADGWQPLPSRAPLTSPRALGYRDGVLYYSLDTGGPTIKALTVATATAATIAVDWAWDLWVEGDYVIYARGDQFLSVHVSGGNPTLLFDNSSPDTDTLPSFQQALSPSDFFWTKLVFDNGVNGTAVRRRSRQGGAVTQMGLLPDTFFQGIFVTDGGLLLGADLGVAYFVPFDGTGAVPLDQKGFRYLGVDGTGVYWSAVRDPGNETYNVVVSPADGGPQRTFWSGLPDRAVPYTLWPDGGTGWLVAALMTFDDGLTHTGIWKLDAHGNGVMVACDPSAEALSGFMTGRPVFTPDGAFIVVDYLTASGSWGIIHIDW